jgi:hypothetical protein
MPQRSTSRRQRGRHNGSGQVREGLRAGAGLIVNAFGVLMSQGGQRMSGQVYQSDQHAAWQPGDRTDGPDMFASTTAGYRRQSLTIAAGGDTQIYLTRVFDALHQVGDVAPEAMCAFLYVVKEAFSPRDKLALQFWSRANSLEPRWLAQFHPDRASVEAARTSLARIRALPMPEPDKLLDIYSAQLVLGGQLFGQVLHDQRHISLDGHSRLDIQQLAEYMLHIAEGLQGIGNIRRQAYSRLIASALLCMTGDINSATEEFTMAIALIANKASSQELDRLAHSLDQGAAEEVVRSTIEAKAHNSHQVPAQV